MTTLAASKISGTLGVTGGGTGATSLTGLLLGNGTSAVTALTTSSGVASAISDEIGSGALVFGTSPSFTTPVLGVASATSINKLTVTTPATGSTLTIADGKTLTASNTLTFNGTDGSTLAIGTGGTLGTGAYATIANYAPLASPTFTGSVTMPGTGIWNSSGNVGIGTTTPGYKLEVNGTVGMGALTATTGTFSGNILLNDGSANSPDITFKQLAELGLWIWMDLLFEY